MIKLIKKWILLHWRWYQRLRLYVIADSTDNSVTFSKDLFFLLDVMNQDVAKVYVTQIVNYEGCNKDVVYAFCINPPINQDTQLADIQYNSKHRCIGFECLCPSVARICYDYGLPAMQRVKLSVAPCMISRMNEKESLKYYVIMPPL